MELDPLRDKLRALPVSEAAEVLLELARSTVHSGRGERLASDLLGGLEDWDELFEVEGIDEYY
jgi:hypothetical protein